MDINNVFSDFILESNKIHIRIKQRNGRKSITTIDQLPKDIDPKDLLKKLKQKLQCGGSTVDENSIQLFGDHRQSIKIFLIELGLCENNIVIHGY